MLSATMVMAVNDFFKTNICLRVALATPPTVDSIRQLVLQEQPQI